MTDDDDHPTGMDGEINTTAAVSGQLRPNGIRNCLPRSFVMSDSRGPSRLRMQPVSWAYALAFCACAIALPAWSGQC